MGKEVESRMGKDIYPAILGERTYLITCIQFDICGLFACFAT